MTRIVSRLGKMHHVARSLVPGPLRHLLPKTLKRVVVVGGGPTGLFCADRLRHHFEVTVVDGKEFFEFTPSILRAVVDPAHHSRITFGYRDVLERELGVEFVLGEASLIDSNPTVGGDASIRHGGAVHVVSPGGGPNRLHFDYCVVAVGASNGFWKPRLSREPPPPGLAALAGREDQVPTERLKAAVGREPQPERGLDARRYALQAMRERIAASSGVVVVGAGLVGVELAAEIAHFFPGLKVALVDGAPDVLPQLGEGAREYARSWLLQRNVSLRVGRPFRPESVKGDQVVLTCCGSRPRSADLFADPSVLRRRGQIRVNRFMQVLSRPSGLTSLGSLASPSGELGSAADPLGEGQGRSGEYVALGGGRIFAVGDAAAVDGVPTAQMIFHGEEMAAVAVANIEAAEDIASPLSFAQSRREMEPNQPFLCCTSLGPHDGMFSTQSELLATGTLAAIQKQMIETTKMSALKGEITGSMMWYPIH